MMVAFILNATKIRSVIRARRSKEDTRCRGESMGEGKRGISGWHATVANWIKHEV